MIRSNAACCLLQKESDKIIDNMKFSITIPSYKSRYLKETVESVLAQTYHDWELIVVDDCSPEDIKSIVEPFLSDARVRYYRNAKNCGAVNVVDNWNICLDYCTGDYVICIGDDDRLKPCLLDEYRRIIEKYPLLRVYHARTEIIDEDGKPKYLQEERPEWESALSLLWNRWDNRADQYIGDFCYDIKELRKAGGYYKLPLAWGSDDVTAVRAARNGGIANTLTPCFEYRQNRHTITSSNNARLKLDASLSAYEWFCAFIDSLDKNAVPVEERKYLESIESVARMYYYKSLGKNCADDLRGNPFKIPYWYNALKRFHFSPILFAKWYVKSIYNVLTGK